MRKLWPVWLGICGAAWAQGPPDFPWGERLQYYLHRTYGWQRMSLLVAETGLDHLLAEPKEWGRDPRTFGYRYSSAVGRRMVRNSIELGLGALLNEDGRYTQSHARGFPARIRHALRQAFFLGGENRFAWSRLGATTGGVLVVSRWYPCPMTAPRFFEGMAFGYAGHLENSFLAEFSPDVKGIGRRLRLSLFRR